jgi:hypothetical protein
MRLPSQIAPWLGRRRTCVPVARTMRPKLRMTRGTSIPHIPPTTTLARGRRHSWSPICSPASPAAGHHSTTTRNVNSASSPHDPPTNHHPTRPPDSPLPPRRGRGWGPPLGAGVPHWGLGCPTGGWGAPLGAGVPHWGLGAPTGGWGRGAPRSITASSPHLPLLCVPSPSPLCPLCSLCSLWLSSASSPRPPRSRRLIRLSPSPRSITARPRD